MVVTQIGLGRLGNQIVGGDGRLGRLLLSRGCNVITAPPAAASTAATFVVVGLRRGERAGAERLCGEPDRIARHLVDEQADARRGDQSEDGENADRYRGPSHPGGR